jgi:hypothetical protein
MTDEEINSEIREEGLDPETVATHVRKVLTEAVKSCQQRLLIEAEKRYEESIAAMGEKNYSIPEEPGAQRDLISAILASNPQLGRGFLTAQPRDFTSLPDEDLGGFIRQLMDLVGAQDPTSKEGVKE